MNYAIQVLQKELDMLQKVIDTWPESLKKEYAEAYKDRKAKAKQLKEAIATLTPKQ